MMLHSAVRCVRHTRAVFCCKNDLSKNASYLRCCIGQVACVRAESSTAIRDVPGPSPQPLVGNLLNFPLREVLDSLPDARSKYYEEYGPIFRLALPGNTSLVFVKDTESMQQILKARGVTNSDGFRASFGHFFPNSMIVLEGAAWQRVRKIGQKALQKQKLDRFLPHVYAMCERSVEQHFSTSIQRGVAVDVHRVMAELTFDSFHRFAYDKDFNVLGGENKELLDACIAISSQLSQRLRVPIPWLYKLPTPANRRVEAARVLLHSCVNDLLEQRLEVMAAGTEIGSLLDGFIIANREEMDEKERLSRKEITDQIGTFFFGAFDTTSNTLAMALDHLANNPDIQEQLAASLANVDMRQVTFESLNELSFLGAVVDETNRFSPTAQMFPRSLKQDLLLSNGIAMKKGMQCLLDWSSNGRDASMWPGQTTEDLRVFRPQRWLESTPKKMAHLPFGHGARICIGSKLALAEMKMAIACLIKSLCFAPDPNRRMTYGTKLAFGPADGAWLHASSRV